MPPAPESGAGREGALRVVIGHPSRTWIDGLESLLASRRDIEVVLAHTKPGWVHNAVVNEQVDILLNHLQPPAEDFTATLADLFAKNRRLGVVALSDSRDPALLQAALCAGARGWVEPTSGLDQLVRVLHGVARGETWYPPALLTPLIDSLLAKRDSQQHARNELSTLSAREAEILVCLARGLSRQEIAHAFTISPHTVRTHINNVLHKLDVHSVLTAVAVAREAGLLESRGSVRGA